MTAPIETQAITARADTADTEHRAPRCRVTDVETMSDHEHSSRQKIQRLEQRLAALQDLAVPVGGLRSQLSFVRDLHEEGRHRDAVQLCDELLRLAERMARGQTTGGRAAVDARRRSERYYERERTVDQIEAVLEGGLLERFMREHLGEADSQRDPALIAAFRSGLRRAVATIEPSGAPQQNLTARIQRAVTERVARLRDELVDEIGHTRGEVDSGLADELDDIAAAVTNAIGGAGSPVEAELTRRVRESLEERFGGIEQRLQRQLGALERRIGDLGRMLELTREPLDGPEAGSDHAGDVAARFDAAAEEGDAAAGVEASATETPIQTDGAAQTEPASTPDREATGSTVADDGDLAAEVAAALGLDTATLAADRSAGDPGAAASATGSGRIADATPPDASPVPEEPQAPIAAAAVDDGAPDRVATDARMAGDDPSTGPAPHAAGTGAEATEPTPRAAAPVSDEATDDPAGTASPTTALAPDTIDAEQAAALAEARETGRGNDEPSDVIHVDDTAVEPRAPAAPPATAPGEPPTASEHAVDAALAAALADAGGGEELASPQEIIDRAIASMPPEEEYGEIDGAAITRRSGERDAGELAAPEAENDAAEGVSASEGANESGAAQVVKALGQVHDVGSSLQAMVDAVLEEAHAEIAEAQSEHAPSSALDADRRDARAGAAPHPAFDAVPDATASVDAQEESFLREVERMLHSSGEYTPAAPPTVVPAEPVTDEVAASAPPTPPSDADPASTGTILDRATLERELRELLPELLREERIKQVLFAVFATEAATTPGLLGDLSGLREFLARELRALGEGAMH